MCWSSDWEEQELLKDEEQREDDERRTVEAAREREVTPATPEPEPEVVRV
jgi:hypothetical protein